MAGLWLIGEAAMLGLSSGPVCVASCGPVLVPSLLCERPGSRLDSLSLVTFLSMRLTGYLLFAVVAAQLGRLAMVPSAGGVRASGVVYLLLAAVMLAYAWSVGRACAPAECGSSRLVTIGVGTRTRVPGVALLGLLTGVSICPPFIAAGIRAASLGSTGGALLFFLVFFVGTSVWFIPFITVNCIQRSEAVLTVARMAMVLIALYYAAEGAAVLGGVPHAR